MQEMEELNTKDYRRVLNLLFGFMKDAAGEHQMNNLLVLMANLGRDMVLADRCSLWLFDEDSQELWTKVAHGVNELRIPMDKGFVGYTLNSGKPLLIENAYQDNRFDPSSDEKTGYHTASVLTVPMFDSKGKVMGVFQAINKQGDSPVFSQSDLDCLNLTAVYSANTIESAKLTHELEETQREIIHILGDVSEYRSQETGDHIQRVAEISGKIAMYLGLPPEEVNQIRLAAPMHDLGKVCIPDAVLNKPGRLTDEEFIIMRSHAELGESMLRSSNRKLLRFAAVVAGSHHERYDGKGYPRGLKGDEIPLAGRICAVADVMDALASPRCYKEPWSEEKVKAEFIKQRNCQFEGRIVDVLIEHWDDIYKCYREMMENQDDSWIAREASIRA
ncbi:MAG: HD domain-containing protein [Fibrobacteraceae bacterium]|nr:HD domain-containing protein [Fibrobacteraceae bacterium]